MPAPTQQSSIREIETIEDHRAAAALFAGIWRAPGGLEPISADFLKVLQVTGNYVAAAFDEGGSIIGASAAFVAMPPAGTRQVTELHSHITGVAPSHFRRGVGLALKLHQREWALSRAIASISWTFDPLVKRNAVFNLRILKASATAYFENFYGPLEDVINAGDESDRLWVVWDLRTSARGQGSPESPGRLEQYEEQRTIEIPDDIEAIRRGDAAEARRWRVVIRHKLGEEMARGSRIVGLDSKGNYLLAPAGEKGDEALP